MKNMTKSHLATLRDYIRDEISIHINNGGAQPRKVARAVCTKYPDLINKLGGRLAEDAITKMVNREVKRCGAMGLAPKEQMVMPGMASIVDGLPAVISVPSSDGDDGDPTYRPLFGPHGATVDELRQAVAALWKSIAADRRNAEALSLLLAYLEEAGADDDTRLSDALQRQMDEAA
ncbi:MAG: hypothetical protein ACE5FN_12850 [Leptospirillia bacterium]